MRNSKLLDRGIGLLVLGLGLLFLSDTVADADLWGHVRFGEDILRAGSIPSQDPYSYLTYGSHWINHEWLSEVIFAAVYRAAGPPGLISFKTVSSLFLVGASYLYLRRQGLSAVKSGCVLAVLIWALRPGLGTIRPHLFTYLGFFAVLLVIHAVEYGRSWWLLAMPVVFALWVNLHGGFLAGAAVLGSWGLVHFAGLIRNVIRSGYERAAVLRSSAFCVALAFTGLAVLLNH
jgi:hypothetical protein